MSVSRFVTLFVAVVLAMSGSRAHAVPSYARELQVPCAACHTMFPQLTAFGRQFKLNGYMLGETGKGVVAKDEQGRETLALDAFPPLSVMLTTAFTSLSRSVPDVQNNSVQLPQEASLFVGGRIAPGLGTFTQLTYTQEDGQIALDNAELRYAKTATLGGKPVTYGAVLNNNPSLEDLWESTPAWGFPWAESSSAPSPAASALVDGNLAQDVVGVGGYAFFNSKYYVASTLYRSAHIGSTAPSATSENTIEGAAPYWRFAWQHSFGSAYLELGTYGLLANVIPQGVSGPTDDYRDLAVDAQYELPIKSRTLRVHGTYIREHQDLNASVALGLAADQTYDLDTLRVDAGLYRQRVGFILGLLDISGGTDAVRFAPNPVDGSANGQPDSRAWTAEVVFAPWLNVQLRVQYKAYTKFNGAGSNYDGFGRSASDNNTLLLHAWLAW